MRLAIVLTAYNRPSALARLLASLARAAYPPGAVPLVISIDFEASPAHAEVCRLAQEFAWPHGPKEVIAHPAHLGLFKNFLFSGGLTERYPAVILLEDDLYVSPVFYFYAQQALEFYATAEHLGGVSLYTPWFNGYTHYPFIPLADDADAFFVQAPFFHGQAWTQSQWRAWAQWHATAPPLSPLDNVHALFLHFPPDDWFPRLVQYGVATQKFFAHPRVSLVTNFGIRGTHFAQATAFLQAPLQRHRTQFAFKALEASEVVYDAFFELLPDRLNRLTPALRAYDYVLDVNGTRARNNMRAAQVLTVRPAKAALRTFGLQMFPPEANVIEGVAGNELTLCHADAVRWDQWADWQTQKRVANFFTRHRHPALKKLLGFRLLNWVEKILRHRA